MRHLTIYAIACVIALLLFPSTASNQSQEASPRPEQSPSPETPRKKFFKKGRVISNRYIVVLNDDVVRDDAPLEVRRAGVTAIADRHAKAYGGKFDYVYETALKGYAIELPNEAAAIAISNLPEVKFVEEDSIATFETDNGMSAADVCRGKPIPVSLLDVGGPKLSEPRRVSLLHGGISQRSRLVIRTRDEFNKLWQQILGTSSYRPPPPEVDFSREMLVVAAMGQKPSSGYEILIDGACEVNNQLEVMVRSIDLHKCGMNLAAVTEPLDIVRLPQTNLPVVFRETEISGCK